MTMVADIASGETAWADIFFLVALILFVVGAAVTWSFQPRPLWATLVAIGLACLSLAWLLL
jgi:hypothetical protein